MLEELKVRNYALIDDLSVSFAEGFNVLSGETGAGKSLLIDALSLALGVKAKSEAVRDGAEEAEVVAIVRVEPSQELTEWINHYSIEPEDGIMIIRRTLKSNGRGSATVQAVPVTRKALTELASLLVDIHGQHEHQSLFNVASHRKLLDRFAGLEAQVNAFSKDFAKLNDLIGRIEELNVQEGQMSRESDYLIFAVKEIESLNLKLDEEDRLFRRQKVLARHEDLARYLESALENSLESRGGALSQLRRSREDLNGAAGIVVELNDLLKRLDSAFFEIEDIVEEIRKCRNEADFNPAELVEIDERLAKIRNLEKKYALSSIADILGFVEKSKKRIEEFENTEDERRKLSALKSTLQESLRKSAAHISSERSKAALLLEQKTKEHLQALGMKDACFRISLDSRKNEAGKALMGSRGIDEIEFLLSANRGEADKPLRSVASGGELSRVMLALKSVLSESDPVPTMIFDEVDSGIGGEVARSVGDHLQKLSLKKQVFCITHLASIAVFAHNHLQVVKETVNKRVVTRIRKVEGESRVQEISRMLAGDTEDTVSLDHAARLLGERGWTT